MSMSAGLIALDKREIIMKHTFTFLTVLLLAPLAALCAADVARERGRPLIGVQRWDMDSWNECSEGGGLIPTMGKSPEYQPDTTWLDEVAGALAGWKYPRETGQSKASPPRGTMSERKK
jgi:hypothetical protein